MSDELPLRHWSDQFPHDYDPKRPWLCRRCKHTHAEINAALPFLGCLGDPRHTSKDVL